MEVIELYDLLESDEPIPEPWIEDTLYPLDRLIIHGPPGVGKTFMAQQLALAYAGGGDFLGRRVLVPGRVHIVEIELSPWEVKSRSVSMTPLFKPPRGSVYWSRIFAWKLNTRAGLKELMSALDQTQPRLVLIDSLIKAFRGDLTEQVDVEPILDAADMIRERYGCAIGFIHHARKSSLILPGADFETMFGSQFLAAWPDLIIGMVKAKGQVWMQVQKVRHGPAQPPMAIRFDGKKWVLTNQELSAKLVAASIGEARPLAEVYSALVESTGKSDSTVRKTIAAYVEAGLFTTRPDPTDKRKIWIMKEAKDG